MNFYNTLFIIWTVDCGEFYQGIRSEKIGLGFAVSFFNKLLVIVTVNRCELLQHTLSNYDSELW